MPFVWLSKQSVKSDKGFVLQSGGRFAFEYCEGGRMMRLEGEAIVAGLGSASFGFGFYPSWRTAGWQIPYAHLEISSQDRERIMQNITEAMTFMDGKAEFD